MNIQHIPMVHLSASTLSPLVTSFPREYSVSEISRNIKKTLEETFGLIRIRGEISGAKIHTSGHLYCALKEAQAVLDAVCWRGIVSSLSFRPEDGMEVIGTGRITTFAGRSKYQFVLESLEIAGEGAMLKTLEDRKKRLAAEGLFDSNRKKPLPFLPSTIGIVTSATGAVIRDILHRLAERFPVRVLLWPVPVQGEGAAEQIAKAIQGFNNLKTEGSVVRPDLLIVARGGGSLEDLYCFNEEIVIRAAAASIIPLISAIGHETDTPLIDHAADVRASTPTAAAEIAVPVRSSLSEEVKRLGNTLGPYFRQLCEDRTQTCDQQTGQLEPVIERFLAGLSGYLNIKALGLKHPQEQLKYANLELRGLEERLLLSKERIFQDLETELEKYDDLLESSSYHNTLKRGFCVVKDEQSEPISSVHNVPSFQSVILEFHDGEIKVRP